MTKPIGNHDYECEMERNVKMLEHPDPCGCETRRLHRLTHENAMSGVEGLQLADVVRRIETLEMQIDSKLSKQDFADRIHSHANDKKRHDISVLQREVAGIKREIATRCENDDDCPGVNDNTLHQLRRELHEHRHDRLGDIPVFHKTEEGGDHQHTHRHDIGGEKHTHEHSIAKHHGGMQH